MDPVDRIHAPNERADLAERALDLETRPIDRSDQCPEKQPGISAWGSLGRGVSQGARTTANRGLCGPSRPSQGGQDPPIGDARPESGRPFGAPVSESGRKEQVEAPLGMARRLLDLPRKIRAGSREPTTRSSWTSFDPEIRDDGRPFRPQLEPARTGDAQADGLPGLARETADQATAAPEALSRDRVSGTRPAPRAHRAPCPRGMRRARRPRSRARRRSRRGRVRRPRWRAAGSCVRSGCPRRVT